MPRSEVVSPSSAMTALLDGLDQLADGAVLVERMQNENYRIAYVNRAFADALKQPCCDLLEQPLDELVPGGSAALARATQSGARGPVRLELGRPRSSGELRRFELSLHPVRDVTQEARHFLGLARDVTRERADLERARLASVELLAAGLSHEVNNPLASITTNLEWLVMQLPSLTSRASGAGDLTKAMSAALVDALVGAERIEATIRYLSMLSGMEDDRRELVDVRVLLDAAVTELEGQLGTDVVVQRQYADVPPVMASEQRLKQAFVNLILNAVQAIEHEQTREIRLRVFDGRRVRVEVEDSGAGVAPDVEGRLFSPFVTTKPPGIGKGLGLFLCRRILEAAGGSVGFESRPGDGATFWVELPSATAG